MGSSAKTLFPLLKYVWAGIILYLTLAPGDGESFFKFLDWPGVDKAGHFVMFFVWAVLQFPEAFFQKSLAAPKGKKYWIVATNSLVLGLCIEVVQHYVPGRSADALDLLADVLGAITALGVVKLLRP